MKAQIVPYSSTVGSSILVTNDADEPWCQLALLNISADTQEIHRKRSEYLARKLTDIINGVPDHDSHHYDQPLD